MTTELLFGTKLRAIRKQREISQSELAKAIGVHNGTVSHWENGKHLPDTSTMQKIAAYVRDSNALKNTYLTVNPKS